MSRWRTPAAPASPYITPAGYRILELECQRLYARRAETVRHLAAAAAEGDRSENAEYIYRKKELREIDRRLGYLQRRMPTLKVVGEVPSARDRVLFGARVTLATAQGEALCYRLVGTDEIDHGAGYISIDSVLARALLKHGAGEVIEVPTTRGTQSYEIVSIDWHEV
jgi:transcription elongation factor GreB